MIVTVPAWKLRLHDSIAEGTIISGVCNMTEERRGPTGAVEKARVVRVALTRARLVAEGSDHSQHAYDCSTVEWFTYDRDDVVRVVRPAPIEACECGFTG